MQAEPAPVLSAPQPAPPASSAKRARPLLGFAIRAGAGLLIISLLLCRYDVRPVLHQLTRERPAFFLAAITIYVAGQVMSAWRWNLLGALLKIPAPFIEYLKYGFIGMFTNVFVPGLVGGDALRAIYLGRSHQRMGDAIASVAADRIVGLIGLFWLAATAAALMTMALPRTVRLPTIAVGAAALAGFVTLPLLGRLAARDRKSTRLNSSHPSISYAVFCLKKKNKRDAASPQPSPPSVMLHLRETLCQKSSTTSRIASPTPSHPSATSSAM